MNPCVIAISGNMGAGKTTLATALAKALQMTILKWDEFDDISVSPHNYVDWYQRGKNYHEFDYQVLADVLESLKSKQSVLHPVLKHMLHPTEYIIFDAPLGRQHLQTGKYIDIHCHLDVPMDVSLSRHLIRDFKNNDKTKEELMEELEYYLSQSRPLFVDDALKASADFIVDGMLTTDTQIEIIQKYLLETPQINARSMVKQFDTALSQLLLLENDAREFGFDWPDEAAILEQTIAECKEIRDAIGEKESRERIQEEIGDLLHSAISLCSYSGFDVEETLAMVNRKFGSRMKVIKSLTYESGLSTLKGQSFEYMLELWHQAKVIAGEKIF